jgi:general secretion pathway protein K
MHCYRSNGPGRHRAFHRQRGAALIVAMLVFALATALVVAMKSEFDRFYQRSANILLEEQAQAYLRSAEELAGLVLLADYDQDKLEGQPRDDLSEGWSPDPIKGPATYPLDDVGWMRGALEDLQGRFNLNALAKRVPVGPGGAAVNRFTAAQEQFIRLLQALGEPEVSEQDAILITESVGDWLDADLIPSADGAEDEYYSSQTPAYSAANRTMSSVSELRAVANMTPQIYQALLPWVTVWPQEPGKLNIHTAPAMVLRSINADKDLSPLSEAEGQSLVDSRSEAETGFENKEEFLNNTVFKGKETAAINPLLGESSDYFLLQAEVEVAGRNMRLYSVLERRNRKISAIARASGSL